MNYIEHFAQRDQHRIYVREYAGEDSAIILMHGLPDNLHLYDRLVIMGLKGYSALVKNRVWGRIFSVRVW